MTESALVPAELNTQVAKYADDNTFKDLSTTGGFLPYIQLMGSTSTAVKEDKIGQGHFALMQNKSITDLGKAFHCILVSWRPKAMQYQPEVVSVFNPQTETFKDFAAKAEAPETKQGYSFGPEFLVYIPEHGTLATLFLGNPTGRREAPNFKGFMHKACTISSHLIKGKKFTWFGPQVNQCNVELPGVDWGELVEQINKFNNPPESEVELAESDDRER